MSKEYPDHVLFIFKNPKTSEWYFHVEAANGEIVTQGEGYKRRMTLLHTLAHLFKGAALETQINALIIQYQRKKGCP